MNKGSELCSLKSFRRKLYCVQVLQICFRPNLFVVYIIQIKLKTNKMPYKLIIGWTLAKIIVYCLNNYMNNKYFFNYVLFLSFIRYYSTFYFSYIVISNTFLSLYDLRLSSYARILLILEFCYSKFLNLYLNPTQIRF